MKVVLASAAIVLVLTGYLPYLRDIIAGRTVPHMYSWLMWSLLTVVIFAIQIAQGAGPGGLVTLAAGTMALLVLAVGWRHGTAKITWVDHVLLGAWVVTVVLWLLADEPLLAMALACVADLVAFTPTVRKSWTAPWSETFTFFAANTARFALAVAALGHYTATTVMWPAMWSASNGLFCLMLIRRRRLVAQPQAPRVA